MPQIKHTIHTKKHRVEVSGRADIVHARTPVVKYRTPPLALPSPPSPSPRPAAPADRSMIGLLTLTAIPTTIAIAEAISEKDNAKNRTNDTLKEARQMRKFNVKCYCAGSSAGKSDVHGGELLVGDGKVYVRSPRAKGRVSGLLPAEGFYVAYPDPDRTPAVLGLVAKVKSEPPLLNWLYIDETSNQVLHANRSGSISHWVGSFGATDEFEAPDPDEDEEELSGITFDGVEKFVVVKPKKGSEAEKKGLWEVWWDVDDDKLGNGKKVDGRLVLRVSLERHFVEPEGA